MICSECLTSQITVIQTSFLSVCLLLCFFSSTKGSACKCALSCAFFYKIRCIGALVSVVVIIADEVICHLPQDWSDERLGLYFTCIKIVFTVMALPTLLYGSENWTLTKSPASHIQAAEMRFLRHVAGYTLHDHRRNTDIRQELNIMCILDRIAQYLSLIHI